jgi:hypothetical protein
MSAVNADAREDSRLTEGYALLSRWQTRIDGHRDRPRPTALSMES